MIIIYVEAKVDPADMPAARDLARAMVTETRKEDGCLAYAFSEDLLEPGLIRVFEKWRDAEAIRAHFATPHMAAFNAGLAKLRLERADMRMCDASNDRPLAL